MIEVSPLIKRVFRPSQEVRALISVEDIQSVVDNPSGLCSIVFKNSGSVDLFGGANKAEMLVTESYAELVEKIKAAALTAPKEEKEECE